jgi:hypothetical protein
MNGEWIERKLAVTIAADVVGYGRLIAADEKGALGRLKAHRREPEGLFRDACCGRFHPVNPLLTDEIVGKTPLGRDLAEQTRWG